ncbi:hypothetical protein VTK73DRAFT_5488 [Phialemonium thermophilum]|uniref:Uncharacterized protein n=1 Tax=Phialemonium thermophilum TaxID=223376 RepID=A0ABR3V2X9_9PEZI
MVSQILQFISGRLTRVQSTRWFSSPLYPLPKFLIPPSPYPLFTGVSLSSHDLLSSSSSRSKFHRILARMIRISAYAKLVIVSRVSRASC